MPRLDVIPTRSRFLELREEHDVVVEGHEFLDKKRILLATQIRTWIERYASLRARLLQAHEKAVVTLAEALARHGRRELFARRVPAWGGGMDHQVSTLFGIAVVVVRSREPELKRLPRTPNPSPEARRCRRCFARLTTIAIELAGVTGNLQRLFEAYRKTERRTRALEDVILPELEEAIRTVGDQLEEEEREEAVRLRLQRPSPADGRD